MGVDQGPELIQELPLLLGHMLVGVELEDKRVKRYIVQI
jgi:hypothetical protein